jgi:hypothetical protein
MGMNQVLNNSLLKKLSEEAELGLHEVKSASEMQLALFAGKSEQWF